MIAVIPRQSFYTNRIPRGKLMTLIMEPQPGKAYTPPPAASGGLLLNWLCKPEGRRQGSTRTLRLYGQGN